MPQGKHFLAKPYQQGIRLQLITFLIEKIMLSVELFLLLNLPLAILSHTKNSKSMDSFTGKENHDISLQDAAAMTKNYRNTLSSGSAVIGHYFGKDAIAEILAQDGCVGIRIYYALSDAGIKQLVTCGVDASQNDMYNGKLAERSINCPPTCGIQNPLNSNI